MTSNTEITFVGCRRTSSSPGTPLRRAERRRVVRPHVAPRDRRGAAHQLVGVLADRRRALHLHVRVRRLLEIDAQHQPRIAADGPSLGRLLPRVEQQGAVLHDEPDGCHERPPVRSRVAELAGAGARREEVGDLGGQVIHERTLTRIRLDRRRMARLVITDRLRPPMIGTTAGAPSRRSPAAPGRRSQPVQPTEPWATVSAGTLGWASCVRCPGSGGRSGQCCRGSGPAGRRPWRSSQARRPPSSGARWCRTGSASSGTRARCWTRSTAPPAGARCSSRSRHGRTRRR